MEKINELEHEIIELKKERDYYKKLLIENNINFSYPNNVNKQIQFSNNEKINIYMDYFKGRSDVYACRWEKGEKSGYSYVCKNKFINGKCNIVTTKCANCKYKEYLPFTEDVVILHLTGKQELGIYPLLDNDMCYFLAVDFDEESFMIDALSLKKECSELGFETIIEKSRSGNGAHVWLFLEEQYPAVKIRKIMKYILNNAINKNGNIPLSSFDRMFPSQDKLVKNGIGNLIALPLSGKSGKNGNTLFVNDDFIPYDNQYLALSSTKKAKINDLDNLYNVITKNNLDEEITNHKKILLSKKDFSDNLKIIISEEITISKKDLTLKAIKYFMKMASFANKKYYEAQNMRLSTYNIPSYISLYSETIDSLILPRGCLDEIKNTLNQIKIKYQIIDLRYSGNPSNVTFKGALKEEQEMALNEIKNKESGIIVAPTGFGKTVLAASLIATKKVNTLILVNNKNLCEQWLERLTNFLSFNDEQEEHIGIIHSTKKHITNCIDIALIQSLASKTNKLELFDKYGMVIFDEAHHAAAYSYEQSLRKFNAKYLFGLTATPKRFDGYDKINYCTIGPVIFEAKQNNENFEKILYPHFTKYFLNKNKNLQSLVEIENDLTQNLERNNQILEDVIIAINNHKKILILTDRINHIEYLENELKKYSKNTFTIHGKMNKKQKDDFKEKLEQINEEEFVIISTGKYIGEGFDEKRLDTLFLTMPFKWKGTLAQYVGRLNREATGKNKLEVHDYIDINVPMLSKMYAERQKAYKNLNYKVVSKDTIENVLYDNQEYYKVLKDDLNQAKNKIIFLIDYANEIKLDLLKKECNAKTIIYSSMEINDEKIKYINKKLGYNIILIDDEIMWYGGINPFIFKNDDLAIARIKDPTTTKQIIDEVKDNI